MNEQMDPAAPPAEVAARIWDIQTKWPPQGKLMIQPNWDEATNGPTIWPTSLVRGYLRRQRCQLIFESGARLPTVDRWKSPHISSPERILYVSSILATTRNTSSCSTSDGRTLKNCSGWQERLQDGTLIYASARRRARLMLPRSRAECYSYLELTLFRLQFRSVAVFVAAPQFDLTRICH